MAFIKMALDAKEPEAAAEGEYDLRIVKWEEKDSKSGNPMIVVTIRIEDSTVNAPLFNHYITLIGPRTDPKNHDLFKLNLQRFLTVFNIPHDQDGFDTDDLQGANGSCYVIQQEGDDGIVRNSLRLPRMTS